MAAPRLASRREGVSREAAVGGSEDPGARRRKIEMIARRVSLVFILLIAFMSGSGRAGKTPGDYEKISALLFPETRSWTVVSRMRAADSTYLRANESELRKAYASIRIGTSLESDYCSFIERVFSQRYGFPEGFRLHDVNGDGRLDVVYSGGAGCAEGNATVVWLGAGNGFVVGQPSVAPVLALRILEGDPPRVSSVSVGCCGGVIDDYFIGRLINFRLDGKRSVKTGTTLPVETEEPPRLFVCTAKDVALRSAPVESDAYDASTSAFMGAAVFGNVLSRYLPGCTGVVLGRRTEAASRLWYFVAMDRSCDPLRTHDPFKVDVGWVEASSVSTQR